MNIELGDEVSCKITGFTGVATAIAKCLTGCDRVEVRPPIGKDKKLNDSYWFDMDALKLLKKQKVKPVSVQNEVKKGGPPQRSNLK